MFNDSAERNFSSGDIGSAQAGAIQRMLDEVFSGPQDTVDDKFSDQVSKQSVTQSNLPKVEFGTDVNDFFADVDRSGDGQVTPTELDFEIQIRSERYRPIQEFFESIRLSELMRVRKFFDGIAGEDLKLSKEDLQAFREEEASLPPLAREIDYNGDLLVSDWEVDLALRSSDDFHNYETMLQVKRDFDEIAGYDRKITGSEWKEYFDNQSLSNSLR